MTRNMPIFHRLLLAFMAVGVLISLPLIYVSFQFSKDSARLRTQQNITQQIAIIAANFEQEFGIGLQRSLKQLTSSEALAQYLSASQDERIVNAKQLETSFLKLQVDYDSYSGIYYSDPEGNLIASVEDRKRSASGNAFSAQAVAQERAAKAPTRVHLDQLFERIKTTPTLLSSGNMEWFMPPRQVTVVGPFADEKGRLSLLAGLPSLDFDNGAFSGAIVIRVRLDLFVTRLKAVTLFEENPIWLFATANETLMGPDKKLIDLKATDFPASKQIGEVAFMTRQDGLVAYRDLPIVAGEPFMRIAYAVPNGLLVKDFESAVYFFLVVLFVSAIAVFTLAFFVARNVSTPIIRLANAASRLAKGELGTRVEVKSSGEVLALVDSFNQMSENLQLANQNRANAFAVLRQTVAQMQVGETSHQGDADAPTKDAPPGDLNTPLGQEDAQDLRAISRLITDLVKERVENLQKFREAKDAADQANRTKSEFLAMMSHEIRTPMNGILGTVQLLELSVVDEEQRKDLMVIRNSGDALLVLIDGILDFSKIEAGKLELEMRDFDVRSEIGNTIALYRPAIESRDLTLEVVLSPDLPTMLCGDSTRLRQIVSNLVSNAIKFTRQGFIRVDVGARSLPGGTVQLVCSVQDSGIGIPAERKHRLFQAFSQVDVSTTRQFGGTGLGLAICSRLCEAMGGHIGVESEAGVGSVFRFEILLRESLALAKAPEKLLVEASPALSLLKVLVVEDHPVNQKIAIGLLAKLGVTADLAENGAMAVERVRSGGYHVVLMDMQMPVMDGIDATRAIRRLVLSVQPWIIAQTANAFDTDRERCLEAGMDDFLSKPFRIDRLREKLEAASRELRAVHAVRV